VEPNFEKLQTRHLLYQEDRRDDEDEIGNLKWYGRYTNSVRELIYIFKVVLLSKLRVN